MRNKLEQITQQRKEVARITLLLFVFVFIIVLLFHKTFKKPSLRNKLERAHNTWKFKNKHLLEIVCCAIYFVPLLWTSSVFGGRHKKHGESLSPFTNCNTNVTPASSQVRLVFVFVFVFAIKSTEKVSPPFTNCNTNVTLLPP